MKNRYYEYIRTIAEEGSFSRAAQKLYISQPALSSALRRQEQDFLDDVKLEEARNALGVPVYPVEADGFALCDAMFGILPELPDPVREESGEDFYQYNQNG